MGLDYSEIISKFTYEVILKAVTFMSMEDFSAFRDDLRSDLQIHIQKCTTKLTIHGIRSMNVVTTVHISMPSARLSA